jgi:molecular chaperone GrpE
MNEDAPNSVDEESASDAAEVVLDDLTKLEAERGELVDTLRRVQADFENYRKRVLREQTQLVERASERLTTELLPVLDNFELALTNLAGADENVRKGVELVYSQLLSVLEKAGLERVEADGAPFDPEVHEAVMGGGGDGAPVVEATIRSGYKLGGRVLRPAMVKVHSDETKD